MYAYLNAYLIATRLPSQPPTLLPLASPATGLHQVPCQPPDPTGAMDTPGEAKWLQSISALCRVRDRHMRCSSALLRIFSACSEPHLVLMLVSIVLQLPHVDSRLLTREEGVRICKSNAAVSAFPQRAGGGEEHVIQRQGERERKGGPWRDL